MNAVFIALSFGIAFFVFSHGFFVFLRGFLSLLRAFWYCFFCFFAWIFALRVSFALKTTKKFEKKVLQSR